MPMSRPVASTTAIAIECVNCRVVGHKKKHAKRIRAHDSGAVSLVRNRWNAQRKTNNNQMVNK